MKMLGGVQGGIRGGVSGQSKRDYLGQTTLENLGQPDSRIEAPHLGLPSWPKAKAVIHNAQIEVREVLDAKWKQVEAVAEALLKQRRMWGDAVYGRLEMEPCC